MNPQPEPSSRAQTIAMIVGVAIGVVGWRVLTGGDAETSARALGGALAGAACGSIPYLVGRRTDRTLAIGALAVCVVSGVVAGLVLAAPIAAIGAVVLHQRRRRHSATSTTPPHTPPPAPPPPR